MPLAAAEALLRRGRHHLAVPEERDGGAVVHSGDEHGGQGSGGPVGAGRAAAPRRWGYGPAVPIASSPSLKQRLAQAAPTVGGWLTLGGSRLASVLAAAGYDWVALDLEHTGIGLGDAADCIAAVRAAGVPVLVRLPSHDATLIKRLLDAGADGLIAPNVATVADVDALYAAMHYPPRGRRGVGLWRAQGWGDTFDEYVRAWPSRAVLAIQIESAEGVANAAALLGHDAVDAALVGPYDLSASLGVPGDTRGPAVQEALASVRAAAAAADVPAGVHVVTPDPAHLRAVLDAGDRFVAYGTDVQLLLGEARRGLATARDASGGLVA